MAANDDPGRAETDSSEALHDSEDAAGMVLDTLAGLLRALGDYAFDTAVIDKETAKRDFEAWARHALVGTAAPDAPDSTGTGNKRDWAGLCRFVTEYRRVESESVQQSLRDLRETVWIFIQGIGRALPAERASDDVVGTQLDKLREAVASDDSHAIRDTAITTIETIETAIEERHANSKEQIELLSARVDRFASELMTARETFDLDPLTGLYDQGALEEVQKRMVHLALLSGRVSTLFMVDIDDFKWVNDHYGTEAGDAVLKDVAICLLRGFGRRGDFVARAGTDEFAVIVQTDSAQTDEALGEHVVQSIRDLEVPCGEERVRVSISVGAARLAPGEAVAPWTARAEDHLQSAKQAGRDRLVTDSVP